MPSLGAQLNPEQLEHLLGCSHCRTHGPADPCPDFPGKLDLQPIPDDGIIDGNAPFLDFSLGEDGIKIVSIDGMTRAKANAMASTDLNSPPPRIDRSPLTAADLDNAMDALAAPPCQTRFTPGAVSNSRIFADSLKVFVANAIAYNASSPCDTDALRKVIASHGADFQIALEIGYYLGQKRGK